MSNFHRFESAEENSFVPGVVDIQPTELWDKKHGVRLIDVRQPEEYVGELGHIPGSELMALASVPDVLSTIPKDDVIVFICRSGGRSAQASAFARSQGYEHVFNMKGGMLLWNDLKLPTEP
jgi:rhodanese-related sulfurtransferase